MISKPKLITALALLGLHGAAGDDLCAPASTSAACRVYAVARPRRAPRIVFLTLGHRRPHRLLPPRRRRPRRPCRAGFLAATTAWPRPRTTRASATPRAPRPSSSAAASSPRSTRAASLLRTARGRVLRGAFSLRQPRRWRPRRFHTSSTRQRRRRARAPLRRRDAPAPRRPRRTEDGHYYYVLARCPDEHRVGRRRMRALRTRGRSVRDPVV